MSRLLNWPGHWPRCCNLLLFALVTVAALLLSSCRSSSRMEKSISSRSDSDSAAASIRNTLQIMEVADYRETAPKTKIIDLMTTDSLIALLPENACYMASSNGVTVVLKRTPEGKIQATAVSVARDSTSARLEVVHAAESEQYEEKTSQNKTSKEEYRTRDPTSGWIYPMVVAVFLILSGCVLRGVFK